MFELASHIHKGVYEIERDMPASELFMWNEFFKVRNEEYEKQRKKSEQEAKAKSASRKRRR